MTSSSNRGTAERSILRPMSGNRQFDRDRFKNLILHIADESRDDPRFGATKLNKILYFADFKSFAILGRSITGATYRRLDRGPAPLELLPVLQEMEDTGEIERVERRYFNYQQKVVRALRPSRVSALLDEREMEIVEAVLQELHLLSASDVSALSHLETGWQIAGDREVIPYETAYISDREPTPTELRTWELGIAERRGQSAT